MSRTMFDSVNPEHIPADAAMVAGYIQGPYAWSAAGWARFPHAVKVQIATVVEPVAGHVLDVERGDASPALAVSWVLQRRAAGVDPSVYCNASTWPVVRAAFAAHRVAEPHWWIAAYNGSATVPAGAVAHQYVDDRAAGHDISAVLDYWPGVDPAPQPSPGSDDVRLVQVPGDATVYAFSENAARIAGIPSPTVEHDLQALGAGAVLDISAATLAWLRTTFPTAAAPAASATGTQGTQS